MKLEDLTVGASVKGIFPDVFVKGFSAQWFGSEALELTYRSDAGKLGNELIYRHDEPRLQVVEHGRSWSFDSDGRTFRLVSEAHRIRLAHLFDPVLAVHTSLVDADIPNGVPENVVRIVMENGRTLKFDAQGFEIE